MARNGTRKAPIEVRTGDLYIVLTPAEEGGYVVSAPFEPGLNTQGETVDEAIAMALDARELLREARAELAAKAPRKPKRQYATTK